METLLATSNLFTSLLNVTVGVVLSGCNFVITGCILEFQMEELEPGFLETGRKKTGFEIWGKPNEPRLLDSTRPLVVAVVYL